MAHKNRLKKAARDSFVQKVMAVSRDLGQNCFREALPEIMAIAEHERAAVVTFALYSIDDNSGKAKITADEIFGQTKAYPKTAILEISDMQGDDTHISVFTRESGRITKQEFTRIFAVSSVADKLKQQLYDELKEKKRQIAGSSTLLICGEANGIKYARGKGFSDGQPRIVDQFGFLKLLKESKTQIVINPWHTYCRRFEADKKRQAFSEHRLSVSVWNTWKGEIKGESKIPWRFFRNSINVNDQVREIENAVPSRPDIRIGVLAL